MPDIMLLLALLAFYIIPVLLVSAFLYGVLALAAKLLFKKRIGLKNILLWLFCILISGSYILYSATGMERHDHSAGEASSIVMNLREMKAAATAYLTEHPGSADPLPSAPQNHVALIRPYMEDPERIGPESYTFCAGPEIWWVGFDSRSQDKKIRKKLEGRAKKTGLYGSERLDAPPLSSDARLFYKFTDNAVWMSVPTSEARQ